MQEGFRIRQCQSSFQEWRVGKRRERGYSVTPLVPGFRDPNFAIRKNWFTDYIDCIWPMIATTSLQCKDPIRPIGNMKHLSQAITGSNLYSSWFFHLPQGFLPSSQSSLTSWLFHHYLLRHSCLLVDSAADFVDFAARIAADSAEDFAQVVGMFELVDLVVDLSMARVALGHLGTVAPVGTPFCDQGPVNFFLSFWKPWNSMAKLLDTTWVDALL